MILEPFGKDVWICTGLLVILFVLFMTKALQFENFQESSIHQYINAIFIAFTIICQQGIFLFFNSIENVKTY